MVVFYYVVGVGVVFLYKDKISPAGVQVFFADDAVYYAVDDVYKLIAPVEMHGYDGIVRHVQTQFAAFVVKMFVNYVLHDCAPAKKNNIWELSLNIW